MLNFIALTPCAGNLYKHIDTKTILLDGPVSCNLISSTGHKNTLLLSPATALFHGSCQTRNAGSDFDGFLPAKSEGNTFT